MSFYTRASGRADDGRVDGPGGQDHAVSSLELEATTLAFQGKSDRAVDAVEDLLVGVGMGRVAVSRSVRPRIASARLGPELGHELIQGRAHHPILRLHR